MGNKPNIKKPQEKGKTGMALIKKVSREDVYKNLSPEAYSKMELLEGELSPTPELVMLGADWFEIVPFDIKNNIAFSKLQTEYREILKLNPELTFEDLVNGDNSIINRIVEFLGIPVNPDEVTFKQFKYLMWVIAKNYIFTKMNESGFINSMTPFFFVS